ncbi:hypothetical protein BM613_10370 [Sulfoacidibacillus thermotolerans]|uniref:Pseudouridine synthase n=2 Tax=Sulfoacidibacillus thermotolerans TaxID=1765684 RepID=A0A2U3D750_SULT2|nr:hypothetical protein BM613_10370 [Sulfoacidibacillus thermotolerans]
MVKNLLGPLKLSRRLRRELLLAGHIRVNGSPTFLTSRVHNGDVVTIEQVFEPGSQFLPEPIPLDVVFEDAHVLVVNKQAGLLVHPTSRERTGTLASAVAYYMAQREESYRFRPVHRLDRDTSGLLILAKHKLAHERLSRALRKREIHREYIAFAAGIMNLPEQCIRTPIGLAAGSTIKRTIYPNDLLNDAKSAVTHVRILEVFKHSQATKVQIRLETGRTHQIRVHLSSIGHPLLGDPLYGNVATADLFMRQALHAYKLSFIHPFTQEPVVCESDLPEDLQKLEIDLRSTTVKN